MEKKISALPVEQHEESGQVKEEQKPIEANQEEISDKQAEDIISGKVEN